MMTSERPDEVLQIHSDHLGTPRAVSKANNEILWRMEGDQFGDVQPSVEQVKLPLRHAGQYADDETGLFYNYYRFYDPKTGRYVTSDPIGLNGGMNTYGYVGGSPLHFINPLGLFVDSVTATCARDPAFCASIGLNTAGMATAMSLPRPKNMTRLEERAYDRYCKNEDDPCKSLQNEIDTAIAGAKSKMKDLLKDKGNLYGTKGWANHITNLEGRINQINSIVSLGKMMGCDMSKQEMEAKSLGIPNEPKPWWRIF